MRDFDGRENMVYVLFLPSAKLTATEKQAVIAEMQRIYNDVLGLKNKDGQALIQVKEIKQSSNDKVYGEYLDASDSVVAIGSVDEVNETRERCSAHDCVTIQEDNLYFKNNGDLNPELSDNTRTFPSSNGKKSQGQFVGVSYERTKKGYVDFKSSFATFVAWNAVHGTGHNASINHNEFDMLLKADISSYCLMADAGNIYNTIERNHKSLPVSPSTYTKLTDWLQPKQNKEVGAYFRNKFTANKPVDNYMKNKKSFNRTYVNYNYR